MEKDLYLVFDRQARSVFRIRGLNREEISGIRPQGISLIDYMDEQNRANGYTPAVCKYKDLARAIWGKHDSGNEREDLTHLVLEVRRNIEPDPRNPRLLRNVRNEGYLLITRRSGGGELSCHFVCGPPVIEPRQFFGRTKEQKQIFSLWKGSPLQNAAIIGRKRSGKTSLLHYLKNIHFTSPSELRPLQQRSWLAHPDSYRFVFVDFQDPRMARRERLLSYLLKELHLPVPNPCSLEQFMDILGEHLTARSIILFDEIEAAFASPELDYKFWESFRSLGSNQTNGLLGFVLTSFLPLEEWTPSHHGARSSPFLNIFGHAFEIGPFTDVEARELIGSSSIPFSLEDIEWILKESRCWPCLLQVLCHHRWVSLKEGEVGGGWKERGLRALLPFRHLVAGP